MTVVRISGEGQYRLPDDLLAQVNELDNAVVTAVDAGDEEGFRARFDELLALVRDRGEALAADELTGSDIILPPADLSFEEAGHPFSGDGLIPD